MSKRKSMTISLAASLAILTTSMRGAETPPPRADTSNTNKPWAAAEQTMREGLDWLKSKQKENGSWSNENYPAMTALGLWAFARSEHPDKAAVCAGAADFIAAFAQIRCWLRLTPFSLCNTLPGGNT